MESFRSLPQLARAATLSSRVRILRAESISSLSKMSGLFGGETSSAEMSSQASESSYPLTKEEAFTFLECNLGIPRSQIYTGGTSLNFLNRVIKEMNRSLPFTTINFLTEWPLSNLRPEDWKEHIMSGQGGTCRWINPFTEALLDRLGYTTLQIPGNNPALDGNNETHISTLVCDVSYPGSRHLVDSGTRLLLGEAVPLDLKTESPEYIFYELRTKLFKNDNDFLQLCIPASHGGPGKNHVISDSSGEKWQVRIEYWLNKRTDWMEFNESFIQRYEVNKVPIMKPYDSFLFYSFLNEKRVSIICSNGQIHATFYNMEDHTTEKRVMTKADLLEFFVKHYPQYSVKKLEKVCEISKVI